MHGTYGFNRVVVEQFSTNRATGNSKNCTLALLGASFVMCSFLLCLFCAPGAFFASFVITSFFALLLSLFFPAPLGVAESFPTMSGDDENEQQISPVTEEDPNGTHTPVTGGSKPLLSKSTKNSFVGMADAVKEQKQTAYKRMKEMEKELKRFKFEEELDSDDCMVLENESRKRQKP